MFGAYLTNSFEYTAIVLSIINHSHVTQTAPSLFKTITHATQGERSATHTHTHTYTYSLHRNLEDLLRAVPAPQHQFMHARMQRCPARAVRGGKRGMVKG